MLGLALLLIVGIVYTASPTAIKTVNGCFTVKSTYRLWEFSTPGTYRLLMSGPCEIIELLYLLLGAATLLGALILAISTYRIIEPQTPPTGGPVADR